MAAQASQTATACIPAHLLDVVVVSPLNCRPLCPVSHAGSIELSWEEIKHVCASYGLDIVREERSDSTYNADQRSMMKTAYNGVLCSAVKRSKPNDNEK